MIYCTVCCVCCLLVVGACSLLNARWLLVVGRGSLSLAVCWLYRVCCCVFDDVCGGVGLV